MKIYNPARRSKFVVRHLHNVSHKFESVSALRSALYHEFEEVIPEEGEYNIGYFEGKQQAKKWLVCKQDLEAMYQHYFEKPCISLWCDRREEDESSDEEKTRKKKKKDTQGLSKRMEKEEELEDIFLKLKEKHGTKYSAPQLRLWARMVIANTHDDLENPPMVPMITGPAQKQPNKNSLTEALTSAACAVADAFSPTRTVPPQQVKHGSPSKIVDVRMKNLEQLRMLQSLLDDGVLNQEEFLAQKRIVLQSLNNLL